MAKNKEKVQKQVVKNTGPATRPGWVVVISIVYFFFGVASLLSSYFIQSGAITAPPEYQKYLDTLNASDHAFNVLIASTNALGAVALFLLRKAAFPLFLTSLMLNILMTGWRILNVGFSQAFIGGSLIGFILGCLILLAICSYTLKLQRTGVLR
jgi:hypothetical protein